MNASSLRGLAAIPAVRRLIELAIDEDIGRGDVTSRVVFDSPAHHARSGHGSDVTADMVAREPIIVAGIEVAAAVFFLVDASIEVDLRTYDGAHLERGEVLLTARGEASTILAAERTALNFVQHLSGIATQAKRYADAVLGTAAKVVDTRKTTPGFRLLEKSAVRAGGCANHRFDLGSGILIKDNHIAACGSVRLAVAAAKAHAPHPLRVEVEVGSLDELDQALGAGADVVLLDNMTPSNVEIASAKAHAKNVLVEVSGGITLQTVGDYARAGADVISVGALTHSAPAVDIALDVRS